MPPLLAFWNTVDDGLLEGLHLCGIVATKSTTSANAYAENTLGQLRQELGFPSCFQVLHAFHHVLCLAVDPVAPGQHPALIGESTTECDIVVENSRLRLEASDGTHVGTLKVIAPRLGSSKPSLHYAHLKLRTRFVKSRLFSFSRFVCFMQSGYPFRPNNIVDHTCFQKACVNPLHLRWVTPSQNTLNVPPHVAQSRVATGSHVARHSNRDSRGRFVSMHPPSVQLAQGTGNSVDNTIAHFETMALPTQAAFQQWVSTQHSGEFLLVSIC